MEDRIHDLQEAIVGMLDGECTSEGELREELCEYGYSDEEITLALQGLFAQGRAESDGDDKMLVLCEQVFAEVERPAA